MGEMVHLRLDPKMRQEIKVLVKDSLFSNETEFIKDAIRRHIELHEKIQIIKSLSGKGRKLKRPRDVPLSDVFRVVGLEE